MVKKQASRDSKTFQTETGCGTMRMICDYSEDDGILQGVSFKMAKPGVCANTQALAHTAAVNVLCDEGIPLTKIAEKYEQINDCQKKLREGACCPHAVAKLIRRMVEYENAQS